MPRIGEMFPSKFLQAEDLPRGQNVIVTIEKVYPGEARARGDAEPEVKWMMRFREYRKPMTLWQSNAKMITQVLGTDETERWIGQQITIYASTYTSFGETKPCINVDQWRPEQTAAPKAGGLVILHDKRPIPGGPMDRFRAHLAQHGKKWDDFLIWSKAVAPDVITLAFGQPLDNVPAGVLPAMKAYLDSLASVSLVTPGGPLSSTPAPPVQAREVIDQKTGEVTHTFTPAAAVAGAGSRAVGIPDDEIPF